LSRQDTDNNALGSNPLIAKILKANLASASRATAICFPCQVQDSARADNH